MTTIDKVVLFAGIQGVLSMFGRGFMLTMGVIVVVVAAGSQAVLRKNPGHDVSIGT
jgi:hypothetical protein